MPRGMPRPKTATHAWCCKCEQMVANAQFNKGQASCRECQRRRRRDRYSKGRMCGRCAETPISDYAPGEYCRKCSFKLRSEATDSRTEKNPRGYVVVTSRHDHPNADARGRIYEHVLVMATEIGRPLRPGENVHHINGVRDDNRPENLELWSTVQPAGQRVADKVAWAKEILSLYEPEALAWPTLRTLDGAA